MKIILIWISWMFWQTFFLHSFLSSQRLLLSPILMKFIPHGFYYLNALTFLEWGKFLQTKMWRKKSFQKLLLVTLVFFQHSYFTLWNGHIKGIHCNIIFVNKLTLFQLTDTTNAGNDVENKMKAACRVADLKKQPKTL